MLCVYLEDYMKPMRVSDIVSAKCSAALPHVMWQSDNGDSYDRSCVISVWTGSNCAIEKGPAYDAKRKLNHLSIQYPVK